MISNDLESCRAFASTSPQAIKEVARLLSYGDRQLLEVPPLMAAALKTDKDGLVDLDIAHLVAGLHPNYISTLAQLSDAEDQKFAQLIRIAKERVTTEENRLKLTQLLSTLKDAESELRDRGPTWKLHQKLTLTWDEIQDLQSADDSSAKAKCVYLIEKTSAACLTQEIDELSQLVDHDLWTIAGSRIAQILAHTEDAPERLDTGDLRATLQDVLALNRDLVIAQQATEFLSHPLDQLPAVPKDASLEISSLANTLVALAKLKTVSHENNFEKPVAIGAYCQQLKDSGVAAKEVDRLQCELALQAFLAGRPTEATSLIADQSDDSPPKKIVLRDLEVIAIGEGDLSTWPAVNFFLGKDHDSRNAPRGPPLLMAPKSSIAGGVVSGFQESALKTLPLWDEPAKAETPLREKMSSAIPKFKADRTAEIHKSLLEAKAFYARKHKLISSVEKFEQYQSNGEPCMFSVGERIGRPLTLAERFKVRTLCLEGKDTSTIVDMLLATPNSSQE